MAKLKIEDLKKIKDKIQSTVSVREGEHRAKITIHMGTCGIAAGARAILNVFMDEIKKKGATDIILTTSGCAGLCSKEPMATIEVIGNAPVKYIDLTEKKAQKIFEEHLLNDKPVTEYALVQGSETTC